MLGIKTPKFGSGTYSKGFKGKETLTGAVKDLAEVGGMTENLFAAIDINEPLGKYTRDNRNLTLGQLLQAKYDGLKKGVDGLKERIGKASNPHVKALLNDYFGQVKGIFKAYMMSVLGLLVNNYYMGTGNLRSSLNQYKDNRKKLTDSINYAKGL